jgi:hypothetical protein
LNELRKRELDLGTILRSQNEFKESSAKFVHCNRRICLKKVVPGKIFERIVEQLSYFSMTRNERVRPKATDFWEKSGHLKLKLKIEAKLFQAECSLKARLTQRHQ